MKDFDIWNNSKKLIEETSKNKLYYQREIWWCSLGVNIGFEQDGKGERGERPVLILKGFSSQVCFVLPLTTSTKKNPYYIPIGELNGVNTSAIISQMRLVDTKRLINKVGYLDIEIFESIRKAVRGLF